ncbi:hypothetical protein CLBKND_00085 [Methylorubrum aminovorans]
MIRLLCLAQRPGPALRMSPLAGRADAHPNIRRLR